MSYCPEAFQCTEQTDPVLCVFPEGHDGEHAGRIGWDTTPSSLVVSENPEPTTVDLAGLGVPDNQEAE